MKLIESDSTSNIKKHRIGIVMMMFLPIFAMGLLVSVIYVDNKNSESSAASQVLFDGSTVDKWGKQVTTSCGSNLNMVDQAPPGLSGQSIRVFLKDGCRWSNDDANKERVELSTANGQLDFGEGDVWYIDFWQRFDNLADIHPGSDWDIWLQTHFRGGGNQPNIILATDGSNRMEFKTSQGCGHSTQWVGKLIEEGKWYHFTLGVKFSSSSSNGWVQLSLDGNNVLPKKSVAVLGTKTASCSSGGTIFDATTGYLKKGIYRNSSTSGDEAYTLFGLMVHQENPNSIVTPAPPAPAPPPPSPVTPPSPTPPPVPLIDVPGSNTDTPVLIPDDVPKSLDGTFIADFDGEGHNDIAIDYNGDGNIDPKTEIVLRGSSNQDLTDKDKEPLTSGLSQSSVDDELSDQAIAPAANDTQTISVKAGPLPVFTVSKPVAYTFIGLQAVTIGGLGIYLAVTKLSLFGPLRSKLGI